MTSKQEQFINDLVQFYRNKGISWANSSKFVARINGKNVDLCELYSCVLEFGGSYKVNQANLWDEIYFKLFKTNYVGANFAVALRQIYNRYLLQYEKSCSGNFNNEQWSNENDDDEENAIFANSHSASIQYSHQLSNSEKPRDLNSVIDSSGQIHNNSKLYCSLLSGLPNELNFAFNVATILSNCHRFDWTNDYKFINVLLESMISYCCVCDQFDELTTFGKDTFTDEDEIEKLEKVIRNGFPELSAETTNNFDNNIKKPNKCTNGIINDSSMDTLDTPNYNKNKIEFIERKCNCYVKFWNQLCLDEALINFIFNELSDDMDFESKLLFKDFPPNLFKKIEERIALIADIIRNISFTYNQNNRNNVSMIPLIKFLTLLLRSDNVKFVNISLDILSNIAPSLSIQSSKRNDQKYLKIHEFLLNILFKNIVNIAMNSNNLHDTTKAFEIMARYISPGKPDANLLLEKNFQNDKIYERISQLLTCHYDIILVLALLEFCLVLSECRPHILVNNNSKTFLKIMVNLLNCQIAQHFTTGALEKIKIIDTRPAELVDSSNDRNTQHTPQLQQNPSIVVNNQMNGAPKTINAAVNNQQIPLNVNVLDNESFAIQWLKATYEEVPSKCSLQINDIYAEYVKHCCRNARRNVIAAQSFNFLLKRCFPVCNINQASVEGLMARGHNVVIHEDPTQRRTTTIPGGGTPVAAAPNQMSPILKAHLSTPPKTQLVPNEQPVVQNATTPTGTIATTTTNFIKSLLANKLRNNQQITVTPQTNPVTPNQVVLANNNGSISGVGSTADSPKPQDAQQKQNIIISQNPATSFALTPSMFSNNIIVPTSIQSQNSPQLPQLPGQQQIFLVRTIITAPGQQNANSPVRLLVPASMIAQPRLPAPNINGMATPNAPLVTTSVAPILQPQQIITSNTGSIPSSENIVSNAVPVIVSKPNTTQQAQVVQSPLKNSSIANSSPLLNVLLDKGKLPDFPNQNPVPQTVQIPVDSSVNSNNSGTTAAVTTATQPKMFFLAPSNQQQPINPNSTDTIVTNSNDMSKARTVAIVASSDNANPNAPMLPSNTIVNGDMKTPVKIKNTLKSDSSPAPKTKKRLKTSKSTDSKKEKVEVNVTNSANVGSNPVVNPPKNDSIINTTVQSAPPQPPVNQATGNNATTQNVYLEFECQWNNCHTKFSRPVDVFYHVHTKHIMIDSCPSFMNCLWGGPEGKGPGCLSKRPKLSLLTHLQDFHCNPNILKQEAIRNKQLELVGASNIIVPQPPAHPGYAQNAAMLAIRRYTNKTFESEPVTPITPLTVSIRLTSALILRNLAKRSHLFKKSLESFESSLCEISAAEGRDESRTIAQCLAVLNDNK